MSHSQSGSRGVATHGSQGVDDTSNPRFVSPWELPTEYKSSIGGDARHKNLADVVLQAARRAPHVGVHWISRTDDETLFETYSSVLMRACRVLASLRARGLTPGDVVVLMLEQPRDFVPAFWGCILGGFVPCPVAPSDADDERAIARLRHLDTLLGNPFVITTEPAVRSAARRSVLRAAWIGELASGSPAKVFHQALQGDLAMLVLTSGSTGSSKAVMLSHENLLASMAAKAERHELTDRDITLNWVSFDHVAALLECHLLPLYVGATQVHAMPQAVLEAPLRFLELVGKHRVTMTFAPNFLLGQINQAIAAEPARTHPASLRLDLSSLRQIISGGEAIVTATARTFLAALAPYGLARSALWPAFGMTETCAGSIYSREFPAADEGLDFATLGTPVRGLELRIVDEADRASPDGEIGELQVRGPMVFGGYYANSQATAEAFTDDGWFRTGDRGSLRQGRLLLAGRSKDSIIVNGVNYYAHELEAALERLDGLERSYTAAFPTRSAGSDTEELVVVFSPRGPGDEDALARTLVAIRNTVVAEWGFRPALILPLPQSEIPKTSLGKIQRALLRKRLESGQLASHQQRVANSARLPADRTMAPEGPIEAALAEVFGEIFHAHPGSIGATTSFFELGGTSLEILRLKAMIEQRFGARNLPLSTILRAPTVRELARQLSCPEGVPYDPLVPLQPTGGGTPLFCVHPGVGEVLVFVNFAKYFAERRPVYALRARGFSDGESAFGSFDEMVESYVAAIRKAQPSGPYALLGYSFGGIVAFEIGKALERMGERVGFLGVVNVPPDIAAARRSIDFTYTAVNLAYLLSLIAEDEVGALTEELRASCPEHQVVSRLFARAPAQRLAELDLDLARFAKWVEVAFALVKLGRGYEPNGDVAALDVFYASPPVRYRGLPRQAWLEDRLRNWTGFSRSEVRFLELPGRHQDVMGKHVADFQAIVHEALEHTLQDPGGSHESRYPA